MATEDVFRAVITAIDHATSPLRAIAAAFQGVGHAAEGAGKHVAHVDHATRFGALTAHVSLLRGHFGSLRASIGEVHHSLAEFLPMLGGLAVATSLVGLVEMTEHVAEARAAFLATATKIGILPGQLGALNLAAKLTDVSVESMQSGLVKLDKALALSAAGKNKDAAALFKHLGIGLKDAHGHIVQVADVMPKLADAFKNTHDPAMRVRMAMALFGKAGAEMLPMLMEGSEGLREFSDLAKEVNYAPKPEEAAALEHFHRSWILLQSAVQGVKNAIGGALAPVLAPILDQVREWVTINRDWIATGIADAVKKLAVVIGQIDIHAIVETTTEWVKSLFHLGESLGGLPTLIGALALVLGSPLLMAFTGVISVAKTLGALLLGPLVEAIGAFVVGLGTAEGGMVAFNAVLIANPIGAVVTAVALLGVAAYELYEHWDWVKQQFTKLFAWFSGQDAWVKALLAGVAPFIALPMLIIEKWEPIKAFFVDLWNGIAGIFESAWNKIKPVVDALAGAVDSLKNGWVGRQVGALGNAIASTSPPNQTYTAPDMFGVEPDGLGLPSAPPRPQPPGPYDSAPAAGAGGAAGRDGRVHVQVDLTNAPPGTRAQASGSGVAAAPSVNVGYAPMLLGGGF